jgi:hypothetical protein
MAGVGFGSWLRKNISERSKATSTGWRVLASNDLVRIDDVELMGFGGLRPIYTLVPTDDPGLAQFQAARDALDRKMCGEALAHLKAVDSGMLQLAARTLLHQVDLAPMRAR